MPKSGKNDLRAPRTDDEVQCNETEARRMNYEKRDHA